MVQPGKGLRIRRDCRWFGRRFPWSKSTSVAGSGHGFPWSKTKNPCKPADKGRHVTKIAAIEDSGQSSATGYATSAPSKPGQVHADFAAAKEVLGKVKWFSLEKGMGFVEAEDGGTDVFVHITIVKKARLAGLSEGQRISMRVTETPKGRQAVGALKIMPEVALPNSANASPTIPEMPRRPRNAAQDFLTAENDSLRLLLEQAGIDAKALLAQSGIEAKEREAADTLQKLILDELHHRIKNTLSTVSAIAAQSLRTATSMEHAQKAIEGRFIALGRAHDLLIQVSWANSSLMNTVRRATEPYDGKDAGRFSIVGPDIGIASGAVIALAMTFNELCTNTTKFGALSVATGHVEIDWSVDDDLQRLQLTWTEKGGPAVSTPTRRSFGTRMMESLGQQLQGQVKLDYRPTGFVYILTAPLSSLA